MVVAVKELDDVGRAGCQQHVAPQERCRADSPAFPFSFGRSFSPTHGLLHAVMDAAIDLAKETKAG